MEKDHSSKYLRCDYCGRLTRIKSDRLNVECSGCGRELDSKFKSGIN